MLKVVLAFAPVHFILFKNGIAYSQDGEKKNPRTYAGKRYDWWFRVTLFHVSLFISWVSFDRDWSCTLNIRAWFFWCSLDGQGWWGSRVAGQFVRTLIFEFNAMCPECTFWCWVLLKSCLEDETFFIEANSGGYKHLHWLAPLVEWKWIIKSNNSLISTSRSVNVLLMVTQSHSEGLETGQSIF